MTDFHVRQGKLLEAPTSKDFFFFYFQTSVRKVNLKETSIRKGSMFEPKLAPVSFNDTLIMILKRIIFTESTLPVCTI